MKDRKSDHSLQDVGVLIEDEAKRQAFLAGLNESREELLMYIAGVTPRRMANLDPRGCPTRSVLVLRKWDG